MPTPPFQGKARKERTAILGARIAEVIAIMDDMLTALEEEIAELTRGRSKTARIKRCAPRARNSQRRPKDDGRLSKSRVRSEPAP
jgi:hypothetical protein